jgi:hypothetical protein
MLADGSLIFKEPIMRTIHLSDLHAPKVPYPWLLVAGEVGLFLVCLSLLVAFLSA